MKKALSLSILLVAASNAAMASWYTVVAAPEIDGSTTVMGLALLSGAMLVVKSRLKK